MNPHNRIVSGLTFDQAIDYAINAIPGLKGDMAILAERRKKQNKDLQAIGRVGVSIPDPLMGLVIAYHPDLDAPDNETQNRAWQAFMRHPHSERFRVNEKI